MDKPIKIKSKEEAIEKTKWLREKLNKWGGDEGFKKANLEERIEFIRTLVRVERFLGVKNKF